METITHGRHCTCSACAREDWTDLRFVCGMHGHECPHSYQPLGAAGEAVTTNPNQAVEGSAVAETFEDALLEEIHGLEDHLAALQHAVSRMLQAEWHLQVSRKHWVDSWTPYQWKLNEWWIRAWREKYDKYRAQVEALLADSKEKG